VATILTELEERSTALGSPPLECANNYPRKLVFDLLRYLKNSADQMRYIDLRCQVLLIMTIAVESVIRMINKRVTGSEKFRSEPVAEAILLPRYRFPPRTLLVFLTIARTPSYTSETSGASIAKELHQR